MNLKITKHKFLEASIEASMEASIVTKQDWTNLEKCCKLFN